MKYDEIVQGEVYAYSRTNATTDYYRPEEAIVLERGGWQRGGTWSANVAVVNRTSKDSLILLRGYRFEDQEIASTEEAQQYTLDQARRLLELPRNEEVPDEIRPPEGWRISVARSRDLSMVWTRWLEVKAEREERTRKLMEARQAAHDANKEAETEMENTLARLDIPARVNGVTRQVTLSFDAMIDLLNRIDKED